jgi:hypothetical protein
MRLALLPVVLLTLAFAPAPLAKPPRRAAPGSIEGLWQSRYWRVEVTATRMSYDPGSRAQSDWDLKLDRGAARGAFDLYRAGAWKWTGLYRVEGDTLTLSYGPPAEGRPTAFDGPGRGRFVETYQRVKR